MYSPNGTKIAILDTETTGRDPKTDCIVAVGVVVVEKLCGIWRIVGSFSSFRESPVLISPEAAAVNGLTNEMLLNASFNMEYLEYLMQGVNYIVAHRAQFDFRFCHYDKDLAILAKPESGCVRSI